MFKFVVDRVANSIQYWTGLIWIRDLLTIVQLLLNLPCTVVCVLLVLNDLFQLLQCKLGRWVYIPALLKFIAMLGISQASYHWNECIWMAYNQFHSSNQNLHQSKHHSLAHHPPLTPLFQPLQNLPNCMHKVWQLPTSSLNTSSGDYLCWSHYLLGNPLPCSSLHIDQKCFWIMSKFQLEGIRKRTVVRNLAIDGVDYHLPMCIQSHMLFVQFVLLWGAVKYRCWKGWLIWASVLVDNIIQLLPVPHICIQGLELFGG